MTGALAKGMVSSKWSHSDDGTMRLPRSLSARGVTKLRMLVYLNLGPH